MAEVEVAGRPRTRTMASHDSKWSHRSRRSDSSHKMDLTESPKDKMKIHGKTDPSKALTELQPAAEALQESTLGNLRKESFTGRDGQVIQEPDASNPTRYRWERPLQTIAGFEDDINRTYREKVMTHRSYERPQSRSDIYSRAAESRRSSYFGAYNQGPPSQYNGSGYYRNTYDNGADENIPPPSAGPYGQAYANPSGYINPSGGPRGGRGYSEPYSRPSAGGMNGGPVREPAGDYQPPYSGPYQNTRENGTASPESDQMAGFSTGPSSYGSSYAGPPTPYDNVGSPTTPQGPMTNGKPLPSAPIAEDVASSGGAPPRAPMKLDTGVDRDGGYEGYHQRRRSSWFKRRFSKEY